MVLNWGGGGGQCYFTHSTSPSLCYHLQGRRDSDRQPSAQMVECLWSEVRDTQVLCPGGFAWLSAAAEGGGMSGSTQGEQAVTDRRSGQIHLLGVRPGPGSALTVLGVILIC